MKIALDLDGTLADTHLEFIKEYNRRNNTSFKLQDLQTYYFENAPFEVKEFHQIARENWRSKNIPLTDSSLPKHLQEIAKQHELDIVTARGDIKKKKLKVWAENKNIPFDSFIVDKKKTHLNYDILVDDSPQYLHEGMKVLLYHRPYNRNTEIRGNSMRVKNFGQIKEHVL